MKVGDVRKSTFILVFVLAAGVLHAGERRLSLDEYRDKMKAALPDPAVVSRRIS